MALPHGATPSEYIHLYFTKEIVVAKKSNFAKIFYIRKTRMIGLSYDEETITVVFIEYRNVTDRRTDRIAISISRVTVLTCDKNYPK